MKSFAVSCGACCFLLGCVALDVRSPPASPFYTALTDKEMDVARVYAAVGKVPEDTVHPEVDRAELVKYFMQGYKDAYKGVTGEEATQKFETYAKKWTKITDEQKDLSSRYKELNEERADLEASLLQLEEPVSPLEGVIRQMNMSSTRVLKALRTIPLKEREHVVKSFASSNKMLHGREASHHFEVFARDWLKVDAAKKKGLNYTMEEVITEYQLDEVRVLKALRMVPKNQTSSLATVFMVTNHLKGDAATRRFESLVKGWMASPQNREVRHELVVKRKRRQAFLKYLAAKEKEKAKNGTMSA